MADVGFTEMHTFEPVWNTYEMLHKNIYNSKNSSNIKFNNIGVGQKKEVIQFEVFDDSPTVNRMLYANDLNKSSKTQTVKVVTLDEYFSNNGITKIDFKN